MSGKVKKSIRTDMDLRVYEAQLPHSLDEKEWAQKQETTYPTYQLAS